MTREQHTNPVPVPDPAAGRPGARPRRRWPVLLAVAVLLAQMAVAMVTSAVQETPTVPVLLALAAWTLRGRRVRRALLGAAVVAVTAVAVVWLTYLVVDPRLRWDPRQTHVPVVHGLRGELVRLLPFPPAYRDGMRIQFGLENRPWQGFLFGHLHTGSVWYYLPVALLVKTPLGMLALWAAGAVTLLAVRRLRPAAPYVLVPASALLASAMTESRDFGTRYVVFLPMFLPMFLAVAAGCVLSVRRRWAPVVTAALVVCVAVSSVRTFPYYLPYSNEAFGGPAKTHLRLHDSNVDWGQDLGRLADRLRAVPGAAGVAGLQGQWRTRVLRDPGVRSAAGADGPGARAAGGVGHGRRQGAGGGRRGSSAPAVRSTRSATRSRSTDGNRKWGARWSALGHPVRHSP